MTNTKAPELKLTKMSNVDLQEVNWLWYPYIALGKITIIQGDPGQGKTHFLLKIAAACSKGEPLPDAPEAEPINVIYQTAEDGLGDTIKPRLMKGGADEEHIFNINEDEKPVTMLDPRVEQAIIATGAKLVIFDPIQAYLGEKVDINSAVEVRGVLSAVGRLAEKYNCAIVLIGHLNKSQTSNSAQRGMGSMDIRANARSVLLVGRLKDDPEVRVVVHDKSSLAIEGRTIAFKLDDDNGLEFIDGYEHVTAYDILSTLPSSNNNSTTKVGQAAELIKDILTTRRIPANEIFARAKAMGISARTVNEAKKLIPGLRTIKNGNHWEWELTEETDDSNKEGCMNATVSEEHF